MMDGIKTKALNAVKTRFISDPALQSDFHGCTTLFKYFIRSYESQGKCNISAVDSRDIKKIVVEDDCTIPNEDWKKMTLE